MKIPVSLTENSRLSSVDFDNIPFGKVFSDHMFVADYDGEHWHSPRIIPYGTMEMSPSISALHYGQAIFEGMKAYHNAAGMPTLFRAEDHLARFNRSAGRLCMPAMDHDMFINGLEKLVEIDHNWIPENINNALYIRPVMFATDEFLGVRTSTTYRFVIMSGPVGPYYSKPLKVLVSTNYVRAFPGGVGFAKAAGNYAAALHPTAMAQNLGYDQLIWLDGVERKYVEEFGTMNLFFIINGKLITPLCKGTILEGITRDSILKLARHLGIETEVREISIDEILQAHQNGELEDAFGSGTAATITHLARITYQDFEIELPPVETRKVSLLLKSTLSEIRTSQIPDPFGWVKQLRISEIALV